MLLNDGSQFITRKEFNNNLTDLSPKDYTFEDYLSDCLGVGSYDKSDLIDALIEIIDKLEAN